MSTKVKDRTFLVTFPKRPKKAPAKAKEPEFPKNWFKANGKRFPGMALDVAIKRGERLEKIVEIIDQWKTTSDDGYGVIKQIYKLAKGVWCD